MSLFGLIIEKRMGCILTLVKIRFSRVTLVISTYITKRTPWAVAMLHKTQFFTDGIIRIQWEGNLPADYYDEFVLVGQLQENPGKLYFKATQICPSDKLEWTQIPEEGKTVKDFSAPTALLKVLLKPEVNHDHHNH
jgi:uncharacterized protein YcnI